MTELFSPAALLARRHYVNRAVAWVPASARGEVAPTDVTLHDCEGPTAVRVDVSRRVASGELLLFADDGAITRDAVLLEPEHHEFVPDTDGIAWH